MVKFFSMQVFVCELLLKRDSYRLWNEMLARVMEGAETQQADQREKPLPASARV
jgi:hypothetical protein